MEFRSQVGQDQWVCQRLQNKQRGYFVDIGAADGMWLSNTYYLENALNWSGICVEAHPARFADLAKNRKCTTVNKAIYKENGTIEFALSNGIFGVKDDLQFPVTETAETLEAITMEKLLDDNNAPHLIDYISLDTEGNDYNVLLGFPFDRYAVKLWTIEHNAYADGGVLKDKIRALMASKGYVVIPDAEKSHDANIFEDWFVHQDYID